MEEKSESTIFCNNSQLLLINKKRKRSSETLFPIKLTKEYLSKEDKTLVDDVLSFLNEYQEKKDVVNLKN